MESVVINDKWRLTLHGTPAATLKPSSVDFHFSLKDSHRLQCQSSSNDAIKHNKQGSLTSSNQISRFVIENPVLLDAEINKVLVRYGVNTLLWSDIVRPIISFAEELLNNYGAATALAVDLELVVENNIVEEDESTCAICLNELGAQVRLTRTPCDHVFHDSCLTSWSSLNNSCPLCRQQVNTDVEDYDPIIGWILFSL